MSLAKKPKLLPVLSAKVTCRLRSVPEKAKSWLPSLRSRAAWSPRKRDAAKLLTNEILCRCTKVPQHESVSCLLDKRQQQSNLGVLVVPRSGLPHLSDLVGSETLQTHERRPKHGRYWSSAFTPQKKRLHYERDGGTLARTS